MYLCIMSISEMDILNYGFKLDKKISDDSYKLYTLPLFDKTYCELEVFCGSIYSLRIVNDSICKSFYVFNRYELTTFEQFTFLMLNGRVRWFFKRHIE